MNSLSPTIRVHAALLLTGSLLLFLGCYASEAAPPAKPLPSVTVATPVCKPTVQWDAYTGRLEPVDFVEIRARVSGYLQSVHFDEGQTVSAGDLLFVIDQRPFIASLNAAKATLGQAESRLTQTHAALEEAKAEKLQVEAELQLAEARVNRVRELRSRNAMAQEEVDQREAEFRQSQANLVAAEAAISSAQSEIKTADASIAQAQAGLEAAQLDLNYTEIHAPVSGRISREYVTQGNLVSGGATSSTLLTTISSVDPIYCTFDVNEKQALKYIRLAQQGKRQSSRVAKNPVYLGLADEKDFPYHGHMDFVDNRFDPDTASIRVRCIFNNPDMVLVPGMFGKVRLPGSAVADAVLIPDSAVGTDQSAVFVYVVTGKNLVERRTIKVGPMVDGLRVVEEGLQGDERVIIQGQLRARPGLEVAPVPGTIEPIEDGLPDSYQPVPEDQWISKPITQAPYLNSNRSREVRS